MFCSAQYYCVLFCSVLLHLATLRVGLFGLCQHAAFSLARDAFSGSVHLLSTPMPPCHSDVFGIVSIHLTLLSHSPPTICCFVIVDSWLPRAKKHSFSAKSDRCTGTARRSDGPKRYKLANMNFNIFGETIFLRLPRSCRVAEKSDPIDRFSGQVLPGTLHFLGSCAISSDLMPPWHHNMIINYSIQLALLFRSSAALVGSTMIDFCLPRAKLCCFSANPTVVTAELNAPMDPDAVNAQA